MAKAIDIKMEDFEKEVIDSAVPVLIDFWAPWCMPCQMMAPVLDEIAAELEGRLKIVKVDIEDPENQALAAHFGVQSIPNLKLVKDKAVVGEFLGFRPKDALLGELMGHIG